MMQLKSDMDIVNFLKQVQKCRSEVWFETLEGDSIALKSVLSQYIFSVIASNPEMLRTGTIRFEHKEDLILLKGFLCG